MPTMLRVNEVFPTIQGEAFWTGTPATFVRLQGCPVGCAWCDTKHTWSNGMEEQEVPLGDLLLKVDPAPTWAKTDPAELIEVIALYSIRHTVITGGEPCIHPLQELTAALQDLGTVQIETSGTHPINVAPDTWVTLSPKVGMGGGLSVLPDALARANEIKMPVESFADIQNLLNLLDHVAPSALVWLQPVSQGEGATRLCIDECMRRGWRLSLQTHKYAGLR